MQISGAGHWFLEGWIDDHAVDFLVDCGDSCVAFLLQISGGSRSAGG